MKIVNTLLLLVMLPLSVQAQAPTEQEKPEVIVITGHLPGPPLWKVQNGDKVLWIFPYLSWIPKDMIWDSERVARVITEAQEVLNLPELYLGPSLLVRSNPINILRNKRLNNRIERNPDGGTLESNLPPPLYARFAALQARYFSGNHGLVEMRPFVAGQTMMNNTRKQVGLVSGNDILKTVQSLARRNRDIKRTEISVRVDIGGSFSEYADRVEAWMKSMPPALEQACFEQEVRHLEENLDEMKRRANSWAQGHIDEFRNVPLVFDPLSIDESSTCNDLAMGSSSSEQETVVGMITRKNQMWLDAAEKSLATNASTFAILPINELLAEDGLLSKLKARGYEVREP
jgi:hypothetical protein